VITDRYPPPNVWRLVDQASEVADRLAAEGREIDFRVDGSGRLEITLLDGGEPQRTLTPLETLAIAAGAPA
jgi:hypothetical protein